MKICHLFLVDPLPSIASLVRKNLLSLNDEKLNIVIEGEFNSIDSLIDKASQIIRSGEDVALLAPFNESSNASLLQRYQRQRETTVNSTDLLSEIIRQFRQKNSTYRLPTIMPFISIYDPERIKSTLTQHTNLNHVVACMSKHILGVLDGGLDKQAVNQVFYNHLLSPLTGIKLMKDLV